MRIRLVEHMDCWQLCHLVFSVVLPLRPEEAAGLLISDVNFAESWLELGTVPASQAEANPIELVEVTRYHPASLVIGQHEDRVVAACQDRSGRLGRRLARSHSFPGSSLISTFRNLTTVPPPAFPRAKRPLE